MRRTGIDLSSIRCNLVDAESSGRRRSEPTAFRVHHWASITHLGNTENLTTELQALAARGSFSRRAWVNLWDVRSSHQYMLLPEAPDAELESRARRHSASVLGMSELDITVSTFVGGMRGEPGHHPKLELSFCAAGSADIRARLKPVIDAGFLVEGVATPCVALWSQARLRRAWLPGAVHAHVALGVSKSALGIFGDGSLLYARDLDWGYAVPSAGTTLAEDREVLADRLSLELRRSFLYLKQYWEPDVSQVLLGGDMPEVRSLTAPLIERLNIEVETLDTLEGIDASTLPEGFAERASTLRLASSIAVDPPPVNLLPVDRAAIRTDTSWRRIAAGGAAAAVALGAFLYGQASVVRNNAERQLESVRLEMSLLPPPAIAGTDRLRAGTKSPAALSLDGPVMADALEAMGNATPADVTLRSLRVFRDGSQWNIRVDALAAGRDQATAGRAVDRFLRALAASPIFQKLLEPPASRPLPDSGGVAVTATYRVRT